MSEDKTKFIKTILWGVLAICIIIIISLYKKHTPQIIDKKEIKIHNKLTNVEMLIDDSEENPYIEGVQ